jgi:hypothetical protein
MHIVELTIARGYFNFVIDRVPMFLAQADSSSKGRKLYLTADVCGFPNIVSDKSVSGSDGSTIGPVKKMAALSTIADREGTYLHL